MANLLAAAALLLGFVVLHRRRAPALIAAGALQAWLVAGVAACQAWSRADPALAAVGLLVAAAQGVAIPLALRRFARDGAPAEPVPGSFATLAGGAALVVLAIAVVLPTLPRDSLAVALAVVLLGLLTMATRRPVLGQLAGLLAVDNGVALAAIGAGLLPLVVLLCAAGIALAALGVAALSDPRIRRQLTS